MAGSDQPGAVCRALVVVLMMCHDRSRHDAKALAEVHAEILRLADDILMRLNQDREVIEEIRETIATHRGERGRRV